VYQCRLVLRTGRTIQHAQFIERNKINIESNKEYYKRRQAIVEHPYRTLKRQWGFYYIITKKGKERASADVGLMFIAYNLLRIINILDADILKKFFQYLAFFTLGIFVLAKASRFSTPNAIFRTKFSVFLILPLFS